MKYTILNLNKKDLEHFNGKIIKVLKEEEVDVRSFEEFLLDIPVKKEWVLTCLVELEEKKDEIH